MGAKSILGCVSTGGSTSTASTTFYLSAGMGNQAVVLTTEAHAEIKARRSANLEKLTVTVDTARGSNTTMRFRKNGANGNQTVTATASTTGTFTDSSNTDTLSAGDTFCYSLTTGTGASTGVWSGIYMSCESSDGLAHTYFCASANSGSGFAMSHASASTNTVVPIPGKTNGGSGTGDSASVRADMPVAGTVSNLQVYISANARTTTTNWFLRNNGTNTAVTVAVGSSATGLFEDTTNSASIAVNDALCARMETGTGSGTISARIISCMFVSGDAGAPLCGGDEAGTTRIGQTVANNIPTCGPRAANVAEAGFQLRVPFACTFSRLAIRYTLVSGATITTKSRVNAADGNQTTSTAAAAYVQDTTHSDTLAAGDKINFQATFSASATFILTSASGALNFGTTIASGRARRVFSTASS